MQDSRARGNPDIKNIYNTKTCGHEIQKNSILYIQAKFLTSEVLMGLEIVSFFYFLLPKMLMKIER